MDRGQQLAPIEIKTHGTTRIKLWDTWMKKDKGNSPINKNRGIPKQV